MLALLYKGELRDMSIFQRTEAKEILHRLLVSQRDRQQSRALSKGENSQQSEPDLIVLYFSDTTNFSNRMILKSTLAPKVVLLFYK